MKDQNLTGRLLVATPALEDPHFRRAVVLIVDDDADGTLGVVVNRPSALPVDEVLEGWSAFASAPAVMFDGGPVGAGSGLAIGLPGDETEPLGWRALEDCAEDGDGESAGPERIGLPGEPGEPGEIVDFAGPAGPGGFAAPEEPEEPEVFDEFGEPVEPEGPGGAAGGAPGSAAEGSGEPGEAAEGRAANGADGADGAGPDGAGTGARFGVVDLDAPPEVVGGGLGRFRVFAGYAGWGEGQLGAEIADGAWYVLAAEPDDVFSADPETLWSRVLRRQGGDLALVATLPDDPSLN